MAQSVVAENEPDPNYFQKYLIPVESKRVRWIMMKAGKFGSNGNEVTSRLFSVACAVCAVVMSAVNAVSYLLQSPIKILLNIARLDPFHMVFNFFEDLTNMMRSMVFVSLGMTFVVAGLLFPSEIFSHFSPGRDSSVEAELQRELKTVKAERDQLRNLIVKKSKGEGTLTSEICTQDDKIDDLTAKNNGLSRENQKKQTRVSQLEQEVSGLREELEESKKQGGLRSLLPGLLRGAQ